MPSLSEESGAFTQDKSVALQVKGATGPFGGVIAGGERTQGTETGDRERGDRRLRTARDHRFRVAARPARLRDARRRRRPHR